jgi:hypothetical protein
MVDSSITAELDALSKNVWPHSIHLSREPEPLYQLTRLNVGKECFPYRELSVS